MNKIVCLCIIYLHKLIMPENGEAAYVSGSREKNCVGCDLAAHNVECGACRLTPPGLQWQSRVEWERSPSYGLCDFGSICKTYRKHEHSINTVLPANINKMQK